jgi:glycosyltransferase involved in cell wall biosynthesis
MPEVAGEAALIVDPVSQPEITQALASLINDAALVEQLKTSGLARTTLFSWEDNAKKTCAIYEKMM